MVSVTVESVCVTLAGWESTATAAPAQMCVCPRTGPCAAGGESVCGGDVCARWPERVFVVCVFMMCVCLCECVCVCVCVCMCMCMCMCRCRCMCMCMCGWWCVGVCGVVGGGVCVLCCVCVCVCVCL